MKNLNSILFLLLAWTICSANFCTKNPKNTETYYVSQDFKDYVIFKPGTLRIYKEEGTNAFDTVSVYKSNVSISDGGRVVSYMSEVFTQHAASSYFRDTLAGGGAAFLGQGQPCAFSERYISNFLATNIQFFSDGQPGDVFTFNEDIRLAYINFLPTYNLESNVFENVKAFESLHHEDDRLPKRTYYAKNIGVIRRELWNGQVWNLVKYDVKQ